MPTTTTLIYSISSPRRAESESLRPVRVKSLAVVRALRAKPICQGLALPQFILAPNLRACN
eukprot:5654871-Pleurochrysis_carterae.AAC.2